VIKNSWLKKTVELFKIKPNSDIDKRSNFRFDVAYVDDLELEINNSKYKFKEISLEGLSFFVPQEKLSQFNVKSVHNCNIIFKGQKINVQVEAMNRVNDIIGCKIRSNKDEYHDFIKNDLSLFLVSYLS
jgi:hypothetical protein